MLLLDSDRIYATNGSGGIVFDTNEGLFRAFDFVTGSQSVPARSGTSTPLTVTTANIDTTYTLASISPNATHVFGMVQLVRTPVSGSPPNSVYGAGLWEAVNGSVIDIFWACGPLASSPANVELQLLYPASLGFFTFTASGGVLSMRERINIRAPQAFARDWTDTRAATTVNYRLYCGAFI